jgi:hypothetical protein
VKSAEEVVDFIVRRIGYIYHRDPLMYGGTADGVDLILHCYHQLWAEIVGRHEDYRDAISEASRDCTTRNFADHYRADHANATETESARHVVSEWRKLSDLLGVPIPHEQIVEELQRPFEFKPQS